LRCLLKNRLLSAYFAEIVKLRVGNGFVIDEYTNLPNLMNDFKWGDQTNLKEHLLKHVTFPATGKVIKETCKKEFPDEFSQEQGAYLDAALKNDTTYNNAAEVMSALNLK
jgi:hypothetical protein